ncbi:phage tail-collar fiber domain-containing protein [Pseudomonas plecoglossicida]|uniref:phage tail-collar fiber domain-containing protein n=1 Tax=Pseudomonas plecoglossicida TaxID=70775 RepID=UPI000343E876|nr:phage tail protein [Pseudomonas plecoglossicida]EPB94397.1 Phage-related tail fiber protein-like protein [Pseudomonas plecoglossicida NB2011]
MVDQTSQFYAILTNVGAAKQANADALGVPWTFSQMAVGDGNPNNLESPPLPLPTASQTALLNEWRRAPLNQLKVDPSNAAVIIAEQIIPADVGGKWIREIALYDADGDMVAVANCPPTFKPLLSQGSGRTQVVRLNLIVSSSSNVQLKIDPSVVLATREWVEGELAKLDFKQSVVVATTANIALSGLQTVDGVVLTAGARVLVKDQTAGKDNGIYVVVAGGAWSRSADADLSAEVTPGLMVSVEKGTANGDSVWQLVTDAPITLGVTALTFEAVTGRTGVTVGTFKSVTVDKLGRVTGGTNPTTLAGYGIVDAVKLGQYGVGTPLPLDGGSNLNTLLQDGVYAYTSGEPLANAPILGASHVIVRGALVYPHQEVKRVYQNRFFYRAANKTWPTSSADDWEPWVEMLHTGNMVQATQAEAEAGVSSTAWMSALRVAQAIAKVVTQATETVFGWLKVSTQAQVTTGTDDATAVTPKKLRGAQATQVEAEAGALDTKLMTPLRALQLIRNVTALATEVLYGVLRVGTQAEVDTGTLDMVAVTPKKMRWGFAFSYNSSGYMVFPTWLGGLIIQWSNGQINAGAGMARITLPLEFTSSLVVYSIGTSSAGVTMTGQGASTTGIDVNARTVISGALTVPPGIVGYTFLCLGK